VIAALALVGAGVLVLSTDHVGRGREAQTPVQNIGIKLTLPGSWVSVAPADLPRPFESPLARLLVGSAPIRQDHTGCKFFTFAVAPESVALLVVEWVDGDRTLKLPPRPRRFTIANVGIRRRHAVECWVGGGGGTSFVDHCRRIGIFVLLGRNATTAHISQALRVLDSLRTTRTC
jgi:hypothetical protein